MMAVQLATFFSRGRCARAVALSVFWAALSVSGSAQAGLWPLVFPGGSGYRTLADQQFSVTQSVSGDVTVATKVPLNIQEQTRSLSGFGAPTTSTHPQSLDSLGTGDYGGGSLGDIDSIHLDFLNGQTADVGIHNVPLLGKSGFVDLDILATLTSLTFQQTGPSDTFKLSPGNGTFELPGTLSAKLSNILGTLNDFPFLPFADQTYELPVTLTGHWGVASDLFGGEFTLEGSQSLDLPLALATTLTGLADISFSLLSTIGLGIDYHLETLSQVPEPGSVALLLIGLLSAVPWAIRRRRIS